LRSSRNEAARVAVECDRLTEWSRGRRLGGLIHEYAPPGDV